MQQHRKEALATIDTQRGAAALLLAIVDSKSRDAIDVFDNADGAHHALAIADDATAFGDVLTDRLCGAGFEITARRLP